MPENLKSKTQDQESRLDKKSSVVFMIFREEQAEDGLIVDNFGLFFMM